MLQNKQKEIEFFDNLANQQEYNVFTDMANQKIIRTVEALLSLPPHSQVVDLGCGSGIFTQLFSAQGYRCIGVDLSHNLLTLAKRSATGVDFLRADVEALPFASESVDAVILSCLIHHLPDPTQCMKEVYRVLKPKGKVVAFDPNRLNPFMYLYRDKSSPFYSAKGVTENERPILPGRVRRLFEKRGFQTRSLFVEGLSFRYVASEGAKTILPLYNAIDKILFKPFWMRPFRAFVFTYGIKTK